MKEEVKLVLALQQVENIHNLISGGQYEAFFASHLLPIKYELERQMCCLTNTNYYTKIKE